MSINLEHQHNDVYGRSFALYDRNSLDEFVGFLNARFVANNINPSETFGGMRCLDAGCGNGRGALFMASNGAASVDCIDISAVNVASTATNLTSRGFSSTGVRHGSLEALPFPDQTFDVVWCNGVIMHTANPDACLRELARVLKVGGRCWIYVYGADGLPWYWISRARSVIRDFGSERCLDVMNLMRLETRYVAEYVDDWTVPYLRTYTAEQFSRRLNELGFSNAEPLKFGVTYDTSNRRSLFPDDSVWMGDGDLRFLATKESEPSETTCQLPSDAEAMGRPFNPQVIEMFKPLFDEFQQNVSGNLILAVMTSANIQRVLRDILTREGRFAVDEFRACATEAIEIARRIQS